MRSIRHHTMHDAAAQTYYVPCSMKCGGRREMWHGQKPQQYIEKAGGRASGAGWVISPAGWDGEGKAFFKHLTGDECGVACSRVIATRPLLCTSVITLHFTPPVIPACWDSVFEQHGGSWSDWLNMMFLCTTEYREESESLLSEWCTHAPAFICTLYAGRHLLHGVSRSFFHAGVKQDDSCQLCWKQGIYIFGCTFS